MFSIKLSGNVDRIPDGHKSGLVYLQGSVKLSPLYFQVLASKEAHAQGLKRRLGITAWREFSEDMTQGLKNLQDSQAYKKTGEAITAAKSKTASVWSSISNSQSFISASTKMGSAFGAAKSKVTASFSSQNLSAEAGG